MLHCNGWIKTNVINISTVLLMMGTYLARKQANLLVLSKGGTNSTNAYLKGGCLYITKMLGGLAR